MIRVLVGHQQAAPARCPIKSPDDEVTAQLCLCKCKSRGASGRPMYGPRAEPTAASLSGLSLDK